MKKLNWFRNVILIAIVASSLIGCSVVRLVEIATGEKRVMNTETRRTGKEIKKNIKLSLTSMGDGLGLRVQYKSHYEVQKRSIMKFYGGNESFSTALYFAESFALIYVILDWLGVYGESDSSEDSENFSLDGSELKPWEKAVLVGVPADFLLYSIVNNYRPTKRMPWEPSHITPGTEKRVPNHPITVSLPQLGYTEKYLTNSAGELTISVHDLISKIPGEKLDTILHTDSIKIDASTNVDGVKQQQSLIRQRSSDLFRALYKEADKRR